jgi:hypothetical protein
MRLCVIGCILFFCTLLCGCGSPQPDMQGTHLMPRVKGET